MSQDILPYTIPVNWSGGLKPSNPGWHPAISAPGSAGSTVSKVNEDFAARLISPLSPRSVLTMAKNRLFQVAGVQEQYFSATVT